MRRPTDLAYSNGAFMRQKQKKRALAATRKTTLRTGANASDNAKLSIAMCLCKAKLPTSIGVKAERTTYIHMYMYIYSMRINKHIRKRYQAAGLPR